MPVGTPGARRRVAAVPLALALVVALGSTSVVAGQQEGTVVGRPDVEVVAVDDTVTWGESTVELALLNAGDLDRGGPADLERRVQTARNVRLSVAEDRLGPALAAGIAVESDVLPVGNVPPGVIEPVSLQVDVTRTLSPGTYELPLRLTYDYTGLIDYGPFSDPVYLDREVSRIVHVTLEVEGRAALRLRAVPNQTVAPGEATTYEVRVENVGTAVARDVALTLRTDETTVFFRDVMRPSGVVKLFVPRLRPGETRVVRVPLAADPTTPPGRYLVQGTATYRTTAGTRTQSDLALGVAVGERPSRNSTANAVLPAK